jgi:hypothetical protein
MLVKSPTWFSYLFDVFDILVCRRSQQLLIELFFMVW